MKALLATAAIAALFAAGSPAAAQVYGDEARGAFAQVLPGQQRNAPVQRRFDARAHSPNPSFDVYTQGRYVGSDPDPFIRNDLARVPPGRDD